MNTRNAIKTIFFSLIFILTAGIAQSQTVKQFKLVSAGFKEGKPVPDKYTCDGENVSPALTWTGAPEKTKSFAIIMDDPDAPMGTFVHWVVYNIPGTMTSLEEKLDIEKIKAKDGLTSFGELGYNGPCPPEGGPHRYIFKIFALDKVVTPKEEMDKEELLKEMKGHILGEATLTGLFRVQ